MTNLQKITNSIVNKKVLSVINSNTINDGRDVVEITIEFEGGLRLVLSDFGENEWTIIDKQ